MMECKSALTEANGDVEEGVKILRKKGLAAAGKKAGRITSEGLVQAHVDGTRAVMIEVNCETDFVAKTDEFRDLVKAIGQIILDSKVESVDDLLALLWPGDAEGLTVAQVVSQKIAKTGENMSVRRFVRYDGAPGHHGIGSYVHGNGRIGVLVEVSNDSVDARVTAGQLARDIAMHVAAAEPRFVKRDEVTESDLNTEKEIARDQALKSGKPEAVVEKIVSGKMEKFYGESVLLEQPYVRDDKTTITQLLKAQGTEAKANFDVVRFTRYKLGEGIQKKEDDFASEVMAAAGLK